MNPQGMRYELKPCTEENRAWAYALKCEVYREVIVRQFGAWNEELQRELFSTWNPAISSIVLVDEAVAGLLAVEDKPDHMWLDEIQVAREWRGRGLGTAIVLDLIAQARTRRKPLRLQVLKENHRARKLYARLGFNVVGETTTHDLMENREAPAPEKSPDVSPEALSSSPRFYHGTRADLKPGDLIAPGYTSNYGKRKQAAYVYLTGTLDAAIWGAELAVGAGPGRIYLVEPTGPIMDDPNLTDKKFPGNPTKSYRSREPLRVAGEVTDWQGHSPEALKAMKDGLERLRQQGVEAIED